jgi:hypothetical protein|nr:MAG TPA: hypothetical protein [Bacteriophage sp.]
MRKNENIFLYFQYLYKAIETESTEGSEVERSDNSFTSSHEISRQAGRRGRRVL